MLRCDYCARLLYKNVSGKYNLCSAKCKGKYKNKNYILVLEREVFSIISNGNTVKEIISNLDKDKFEVVSAVRRMVYKHKKLTLKKNTEINLSTKIFIKKK